MPVRILIAALALNCALAWAQTPPASGVEAQMILTVADHMNHRPPPLKPGDVTIVNGTVTGLVPLAGGRDLELFILIDDAANYDFGSKLPELRRFISGQPGAVATGIAYIHDGALQIIEKPTTDHQLVARALRAPSGSKAANPYCAISDLINEWPGQARSNGAMRREIVLVTSGIDSSSAGAAVCVNAETTIRDAERAGVVVYALYNPVSAFASEKWSDVDAGIVHLAHVCYETGGEAYFVGHSPAESFAPFLADIAEHLANQYLVKFRYSPGPGGGFHAIQVNGKSADLELMKPSAVWFAGPPVTGGN